MPFDNPPQPSRRPETRLLEQALWSIRDEEHWCKRAFSRERHSRSGGVIYQRCAVTAVLQVADVQKLPATVVNRAFEALAEQITLPRLSSLFLVAPIIRQHRRNRKKVIWFNDLRRTHHADVVRLFRMAIERLESSWPVDPEQRFYGLHRSDRQGPYARSHGLMIS